MNAILLVIVLAHGGFWFDGENSLTVTWARPEAGTPAAVLSWTLSYGNVQLAAKEIDVAGGDKATTLTLELPEARVATEYLWKYALKDKQTGKLLEEGSRRIHLLPRKLFAGQAKRLQGKKLIVVEKADPKDQGIAAILKQAEVQMTRIDSLSDLQLSQPDILLVAQNQLPESAPAQQVLLDKARQGANIMIFAQASPATVCEWPLRPRKSPGTRSFTWNQPHALFDSFEPAALDHWAKESATEFKALALPADAPVLELACWPRETPGNTPVPIDALIATQTIGDRGGGRIVYWQIPIDSWKADPRAQLLLTNALDYLLTRPEPTLPQAQRQTEIPSPNIPADKQRIGAEP